MKSRYRYKTRLGPSGLVYVVVASLILCTGIYAQNNLLFWAFGLMVGGVLASVLVAWLSMKGLRIERLPPDHAVVGQPLVLRYLITNPKLFMPVFSLVVTENWGKGSRGWRKHGPVAQKPQRLTSPPIGWVMHLGPKQIVQAEAMCWPCRRGHLNFERIVLTTTFPFGFLRQSLEVEQSNQVLVYPRLHRLSRSLWFRLAAADPGAHLQIDQGGGTEEFFGLRRYRPGDSQRHVDWKHTARTGQLISRELTIPCPPRVMLALDLSQPQVPPSSPDTQKNKKKEHHALEQDLDDPVEQAISLAASVICGAHLQGYQTGMAVVGFPQTLFRIHHSLTHRNNMLEALALLDLGQLGQGGAILPAEPTVLVRVGDGPPPRSRGMRAGNRCLIMDVGEKDQYIREGQGDTLELLSRTVAVRSHKQRRKMGETWT